MAAEGVPAAMDKILTLCRASPTDTILFSSEVLSAMNIERVTQLQQLLATEFSVTIVCFVRDPFDFSYSAWKQMIKTVNAEMPFRDWLHSLPPREQEAVSERNFLSMFSGTELYNRLFTDVRLINYDHHKGDIVQSFLQTADLIDARSIPLDNNRICNPSLTHSQTIVQQIANQSLGNTSLPSYLSKLFLAEDSTHAEIPFYDPVAHRFILEKYAEPLRQINALLSDSDQLSTDIRSEPYTEPAVRPKDIQIFSHLVAQAVDYRNKPIHRRLFNFLNRLLPVPIDFDTETYLFLNPDIKKTGSNPWYHYFRHGRHEGRHYKIL